jgi:hypothetical protein
MRRYRRRRRNSWRGDKAGHARAARKGWRHRKARRYGKHRRSRKGRRHVGKKYVRVGGRRLSWKGLVKRFGVKKAKKLYHKRGRAHNRKRFRRHRR